jgi:hypothetical protein
LTAVMSDRPAQEALVALSRDDTAALWSRTSSQTCSPTLCDRWISLEE